MDTIRTLGDRALVAYFDPQAIDERVHCRVLGFARSLGARPLEGQLELVPAYASVTLLFREALDPATLGRRRAELTERLAELDAAGAREDDPGKASGRATAPLVEIPVRYGGEGGPDLAEVAALHGISAREVIRLHTEAEYRVFQIGFTPGFPYLGGLSERLATPRRATPRTRVPAGSVGIGDAQTGIYSVDGPGGWNLIGRTELKLFDPLREENPSLLRAGMRIRFVEARE